MKEARVVFSGCGTVFATYAGVYRAIESEGILITDLCGTSGGAIMCGMIASGRNSVEIEDIIYHLNLKSFEDYSWNPLYRMGLIAGDKIYSFLKKVLPGTLGDTEIPLTVITTDIETKECIALSSKFTPDVLVADAIRASMSIPLMFKYFEIQGRKLVDGGTTNNFNVDGLNKGENVLGVRVKGSHNPKVRPNLSNPGQYIGQVIDCMMEANEREHIEDATYAKILNIQTEYNHLSFDHTKDDMQKMFRLGFTKGYEWLRELKKKERDTNAE